MKVWHILLSIVITAAVVGGGMYIWQQSQFNTLSKAIEELKTEPATVEESEDKEETSQLISLDSNSSACTQEPSKVSLDIGYTRTIYPVAVEYKTTADDYHQIAGLFTAAACGEDRLNELFGSKTFSDVVIFTDNPSSDLVTYLKGSDFICSDEEVPDSDCSHWYKSGSVSVDVMVGLRKWAEMIYGSDCKNCG